MQRSRALLKGLALAAVGAFVLSACGSSSSSSGSSSSSAAGTPRTGGVLKLVGQGDVDYMDTADAYYAPSYTVERAFARQLYTYPDTPTFASQANPVPDLATAMPTISNNGTVYTIHIRSGAMWDTNPPRQVTADDAILGFKRLCNPASPVGAPQYYTATIVGMSDYCNAFANVGQDATSIKNFIQSNNISGLKAVNETTLQITLTQPASDFVNILAMPFSSPAPVEYLNYVPGSADQAQHTISDGPYTITKYVPTTSILMDKNPAWKQSSDPVRHQYVNQIQITEGVADANSAVQQIQAGTSDMEFDQNVPTSMLASMVATHDPNLVIGPDGNNFVTINPYISINLQSPNNGGALSKPLVRQALEYAFNKTADSQIYGGAVISKPLNQVVPAGSVGNIANYNPYPTPGDNGDPAKAKALLAQAGYQPGQITLKLIYRTNTVHPQIAQTDQAALQAAGFGVQLIAVTPANTIYTKYLENPQASTSGAWDIAEPGWIPDWFGNNGRSVIAPLFDGRTYGKNTQDYGDYNSPVVNSDIDKALAATTTAQATQYWQAAARQIMSDAAIVPIGAQKVSIYHSSRVANCNFYAFSQNCDVTNVWLKS